MKQLINFLNKPETTMEDLTIILTGAVAFAGVCIMIILALTITGN